MLKVRGVGTWCWVLASDYSVRSCSPEDSLRDAVIGYIGDDEEDPPQAFT